MSLPSASAAAAEDASDTDGESWEKIERWLQQEDESCSYTPSDFGGSASPSPPGEVVPRPSWSRSESAQGQAPPFRPPARPSQTPQASAPYRAVPTCGAARAGARPSVYRSPKARPEVRWGAEVCDAAQEVRDRAGPPPEGSRGETTPVEGLLPARESSTRRAYYCLQRHHPRGPVVACGQHVALAWLGGSWTGHGGAAPQGHTRLNSAANQIANENPDFEAVTLLVRAPASIRSRSSPI